MMENAMVWTEGDLAVLGCICAYKDVRAARPAVRALKARYKRVEVPTVGRIEMCALLMQEGFRLEELADEDGFDPYPAWVWGEPGRHVPQWEVED